MADLQEYQFELDGYVFGDGMPVFVDKEGFDPGDSAKTTQDGVNPITGARMFGRDMHSAATWVWACHVDRDDIEGALASAAEMGAVWKSEKWLDQDAIGRLRYQVAGRTRCIFGRPRRFSFKPGNAIIGGTVPPLASFDASDDKHYDDDEQVVELQLAPSVPGGFAVPFAAPLAIEVAADYTIPGGLDVGGDTSTAAVIEFVGPVTDPKVTIGDFVVGLVGTIGPGSTVTVDARPWSMGITRAGLSQDVVLARGTRLTQSRLKPGSYSAVFVGTDITGSARCRVRWRNAYTTL